MPTRTIDDIELYYEIHGNGPPLMLIAGLASDSQSWQPILEDLARHHRVILTDNRGVGRTSPQTADISLPTIADNCATLIRELGFSRVHLLGHSMGGFIARDLALRYPRLVEKLIVAGTAPSISKRNLALFSDWASDPAAELDPGRWFRGLFYWIFTRRFFKDDAVLDEAVRYAVTYPYPQSIEAFRNQVAAISSFDFSRDLSGIRAKTLVIGGREDILFPVEESRALAVSIPGAVLKIIDQAAHSIHMEQPTAFADAVLDFLAR